MTDLELELINYKSTTVTNDRWTILSAQIK